MRSCPLVMTSATISEGLQRRQMEKEESWVNLKHWEGGWGDVIASWLNGMADQLLVGDHAVVGCCKIKWDEEKGTHVEHTQQDPIDVTGDEDWFDGESSLPMEGKIEVVEEMVVKTEDEDAGRNSEEDVDARTEGDEEVVAQGKALALLDPSPRASRTRHQNPNHARAN